MGGREYDEESDAAPRTFRSAGHFMWEASEKLGLKPEQVFQALGVTSAAGIADPQAAWETLRNSV